MANPRISFCLTQSDLLLIILGDWLLASPTQCPWMSHGPQGYLGWLFQETWLASLALPLLPPIIPFYVSPRNRLVLHALILSVRFTWYSSSSPIRLQTRPLWLWMHLEFERKTKPFIHILLFHLQFQSEFPSVRQHSREGAMTARQHAIFHQNTNTRCYSSRLVKW